MDLIDLDEKQSLHLAGRLDRATSGLVLLSNDGRWTESITSPQSSVRKVYRVETVEPMKESDVAAFAAGFYFHTEHITTLPCELEILEDHRARVTLQEGRYHQIKRMFHRVGNRVKSLHRERIGSLSLPPELAPGSWRRLTEREVKSFGDG
jgi:16S rRNA pseudouridine516 synthase